MATLDDLADYLAAQGITGLIAKGSLPDTPDAVVALRPYGGYPPQHTFGQDNTVRRPTIQIVARAGQLDFEAAQTKAEACYQALTRGLTTINSNRYMRIEPLQSEPFPMGKDANDRWEIGFNILIHKG